MEKKTANRTGESQPKTNDSKSKKDAPGYPLYPAEEDIYSNAEEVDIPLNSDDAITKQGLDVPGSELDDAAEEIGAEDEENNLYSEADNKEED